MRLAALLCCCLTLAACVSPLIPGRSTTLSGELLRERAFCSRTLPSEFDGTWEPAERDIRVLETRLRSAQSLSATQCCLLGARINDVDDYYRQYFGLIIQGTPMIYVNAVAYDSEPEDWHAVVIDLCDGGPAAWGVLYDPRTGYFHNLAVNGVD